MFEYCYDFIREMPNTGNIKIYPISKEAKIKAIMSNSLPLITNTFLKKNLTPRLM